MPVQAYPMVWADSHEIPRASRYSGTKPNAMHAKPATRLSRSTARHPNPFTSHTQKRSKNRQILNDFVPQHRPRNPCRVSHANGLANTRYRSPPVSYTHLGDWLLRDRGEGQCRANRARLFRHFLQRELPKLSLQEFAPYTSPRFMLVNLDYL